jgi:hypothetical protein
VVTIIILSGNFCNLAITGTKDVLFLDKSRLEIQALEIKAKAVYRRIFENSCVGGSIPPRVTKKHQNYPRVVFSFSFGIKHPTH